MHRILIVGSAKLTTGFGRVVTNIADSLSGFYDIHVLAYDVFEHVGDRRGWTLHVGRPKDVFALRSLGAVSDAVQPDAILIINDFWFVPAFLRALEQCSHRTRTVAYVPVDANLTDYRRIDGLRNLDGLAVYTDFARRVLINSYPPDVPVPNIFRNMRVIPHGNAVDVFRPMVPCKGSGPSVVSRLQARNELLGMAESPDGFWVLNANKNSHRKRLDLTFHGFALFARDKPPTVKLYVHSGRRDTGPDLRRLAKNFGLESRLVLTRDTEAHPDVSLEHLNLIYNACDVGVHTSIGEGWGLVAFEHAATAAAQIVPRHSSFAELWQGAAEFVEPVESVSYGDFLQGHAVSAFGVASALEKLFSDMPYRIHLSRAAYINATRREFAWSTVASQWVKFLSDVL
jgi:D-inositol-3-phosphate glycosyltransferase